MSTSTWINASIFQLVFLLSSLPSINSPSFMQKLVEHSQSKDQFLMVAIKRLNETQLFEDELVEESREKFDTCFVDFP
jgi:hypothetical protein